MKKSSLALGRLANLVCVFCDIIAKKTPAHIVYEDEDLVAILDKHPVSEGHTLVLTKHHYERFGEIPQAEIVKLFSKVQELNEKIRAKMKTQGSHISVNDGKAAHQLVPHIHVHIVPRSQGDNVSFMVRKQIAEKRMEEIGKLIT